MGDQAYIMIGNQIKYEPAWVLSSEKKKKMACLRAEDALASITGKSLLILFIFNRLYRWNESSKYRCCETNEGYNAQS